MKKLIAIAVMIALVAGAVFADSSISGGLDVRAGIGNWTGDKAGDKDADVRFTGGPAEGQIQWSGRNDEESFGGALRVRVQDDWGITGDPAPNVIEAWWKPLDQLRIYLGQNGDALFESVNMNHWGYNQGAEGWVTTHDWKYWRTLFPGAEDKYLLAFNFYLMDGLDLNLIYGFGGSSVGNRGTDKFSKFYGNLHLNAGYSIEGVGKILFDWIGPGNGIGEKDANDDPTNPGMGTIGFSFYSGDLVDGLSFHIGFAKFLTSGDKKSPTHIGLGVAYLGGEWGVKFRAGMTLDGRPGGYGFYNGFNSTGTYADGMTHMVFTVMPWYDLGNMKINLDFGFIMNTKSDNTVTSAAADVGKSVNGFWLNPYLTVPGGPGKFQVGMKIFKGVNAMGNWDWMGEAPQVANAEMQIAIPMRFVFSF